MRILLAEDERSLSRAMVAILEKNNYSVDAVYDGAEALKRATLESYDAVIMDIMMPRMDGIAAIRGMRERGIMTPIIVLSAKSEVDDKVLGLDSGANDYLTKPFEIKELLARLRAITRRGENRGDSILRVANAELNSATFVISTEFASETLRNREFQMLEMLMRNQSSLISTEHFMQKIWGSESDAEINVVWVYISYLRKKLEKIKAGFIIKAHRNAGYSLEIIEND